MVDRITKALNNLIDRLFISGNVQRFKEQLKSTDSEHINIVLFDYTSSYSVVISFFHIINVLKRNLFNVRFYYIDNSNIKQLDRLKIPNRKFDYLYNIFMQRVTLPEMKNIDYDHIKRTVFTLDHKDDIVNYTIDGLLVGDLIYDTYLKWEKKPTVDMDKKKLLLKYFLQAHKLYIQAQNIHSSYSNIKYFFAGDIAYIYSGILARYLANKEKNVINFIESNGLQFNFLDKEYFFRRKKYWLYPQRFQSYSIKKQEHSILIAKDALHAKLIDGKTNYVYMKQNTFSNDHNYTFDTTLETINNLPFKVLIPLHCFMDSPHIYRWMVYPDFFEWITDTLRTLEKQGIQGIVKPHPNGFPENDAIVEKLKVMFPNHFFIDKTISNQIFIDMKVDIVLTVYGSVGYEFSYFNIPVICAGDNPHVAYNFTKSYKTRKEYHDYLLKIREINISIDQEEIFEFYYMHYIENDSIEGINPVYPIEEFLNIVDKDASPQLQREAYHHNQDVLKIELEKIDRGDYIAIEQKISDLLLK